MLSIAVAFAFTICLLFLFVFGDYHSKDAIVTPILILAEVLILSPAHLATAMLLSADCKVLCSKMQEASSPSDVEQVVEIASGVKSRWRIFLVAHLLLEGSALMLSILVEFVGLLKFSVKDRKMLILQNTLGNHPVLNIAFLFMQIYPVAKYNDKVAELLLSPQAQDPEFFVVVSRHTHKLQFTVCGFVLSTSRFKSLVVGAILSASTTSLKMLYAWKFPK
jgi:hypothetical protein